MDGFILDTICYFDMPLLGNHDLFPLNHQEISFRGSFWGSVLALYHLLFIDKFVISNRK